MSTQLSSPQTNYGSITQSCDQYRLDPDQSDSSSVGEPAQAVAIHIKFEIKGNGEFRIGETDTSSGIRNAWMRSNSVVRLEALPAAGYEFSHWEVQDEPVGSCRTQRLDVQTDMVIKAVFTPVKSSQHRC